MISKYFFLILASFSERTLLINVLILDLFWELISLRFKSCLSRFICCLCLSINCVRNLSYSEIDVNKFLVLIIVLRIVQLKLVGGFKNLRENIRKGKEE